MRLTRMMLRLRPYYKRKAKVRSIWGICLCCSTWIISCANLTYAVHLYKSEFSRAKSTFDASLQICENLLGKDSNACVSSLYCLGVTYHCLKDYSHSIVSFQECIRIGTKVSSENKLLIAQSLCWLGRNHQCLREPSTALEKYLSSLQQCKLNKQTVDYRIVVMLLHTIGQIYEEEQVNQQDMALKCKANEQFKCVLYLSLPLV